MKLISQSIKTISRVFRKVLKYFNSTAISTSFVLPQSVVLPVILIFDLNDGEFTLAAWISFL